MTADAGTSADPACRGLDPAAGASRYGLAGARGHRPLGGQARAWWYADQRASRRDVARARGSPRDGADAARGARARDRRDARSDSRRTDRTCGDAPRGAPRPADRIERTVRALETERNASERIIATYASGCPADPGGRGLRGRGRQASAVSQGGCKGPAPARSLSAGPGCPLTARGPSSGRPFSAPGFLVSSGRGDPDEPSHGSALGRRSRSWRISSSKKACGRTWPSCGPSSPASPIPCP